MLHAEKCTAEAPAGPSGARPESQTLAERGRDPSIAADRRAVIKILLPQGVSIIIFIIISKTKLPTLLFILMNNYYYYSGPGP